jgi:hypothetical protein
MIPRLMPAAALAGLVLGLVSAGSAPAQQQPAPRIPSDLWFDATQLPSFTGTVERYLLNPRGETDGLLFREGPQVVFPPDVAEAVREAAPPGRPIVVWGIRARHAPVITMLAYAPSAEAVPGVVERFYWRLGGRVALETAERIAVAGTVRQPYFTPQGEAAGAVLEDGTVVVLPAGAVEPFRDLLRRGARLAAEGRGVAGEAGRAVVAERIGESAEALRPVAPRAQR